MKKYLLIPALTVLFVICLDIAVAGVLKVADGRGGPVQSLVRYFEYGRSVPGKIDRWIAHPRQRDSMLSVAWQPDLLEKSQASFATEDDRPGTLRGYGMSFLAQMMRAAAEEDPDLRIDLLGGPAAPPNFAYELFLADRANRRPGDVVVFGILSSSMTSMAALSNRSWAFEQPAPTTYPIFWPEGETGLRKIVPLVHSEAEERALRQDPQARAAWNAQMKAEDYFYSTAGFGLPLLDHSPLLRLLRRAWVMGWTTDKKASLVSGQAGYPFDIVLTRMIRNFAQIAREDGQIPVVYLIQGRDPQDFDLMKMTGSVLMQDDIPYLATVDVVSPRNPANFANDGHYIHEVNVRFGHAFLELLDGLGVTTR